VTEPGPAIALTEANTQVSFVVPWFGVIPIRGRFTKVEGALRIPDGCFEESAIHVEVTAASLTSGINLRDRHLRGARFLDAARYPRIAFRSVRVTRQPGNGFLCVSGLLSLHGVEREVTATCPLDYARGLDGNRSSLVRMRAELSISRLEYGVGTATGLRRLNPLLRAIGRRVLVRVEVLVPAAQRQAALLPALDH
jgi:polyisoprenoid-binding protein YceI